MNELDIKGEKYISSKRAADITGYAPDYVGQLARGKKINATRVGRSWYVSESDILKHAGKLEENLPPAISEEAFSPHSFSASTKPLHSLRVLHEQEKKFKTWGSVSYEREEVDLFPRKNQTEPEHTVVVKKIVNTPVFNTSPVAFNGLVERGTPILVSYTPDEPQKPKFEPSIAFKKPNQSLVPSYLAFSAITLSTIALIFSVSGVGVSNDWAISAHSQLGNTYSADFSLILVYLKEIIREGVQLILVFLNILLAYLEEYFVSGFEYILSLFNLG